MAARKLLVSPFRKSSILKRRKANTANVLKVKAETSPLPHDSKNNKLISSAAIKREKKSFFGFSSPDI